MKVVAIGTSQYVEIYETEKRFLVIKAFTRGCFCERQPFKKRKKVWKQ